MHKPLLLLTLLAACVLLPILVAHLISRIAPVGGVELTVIYVVVAALAVHVWRSAQRGSRRA